jgi:asparagine synthase (glutamine-hydrolysing)
MCGIWASITPDHPDIEAFARRGIEAVAHRGPDGAGYCRVDTKSGVLTLGHRRLSIFDLSSAGDQPMRRGPLTVVFNGSLYDYRDVRQELEELGDRFLSESDTEVLLAAWLRWGPKAMARFDGMFALALYDERTQTLCIARDRFGEKPLHIYETEREVVIGSEIGQFHAVGKPAHFQPNPRIIKDYLDHGIAEQGEETFVRGISRLLPGQCRIYDLSGNQPRKEREFALFDPPPLPDPRLGHAEAAKEALNLALKTSVRRRMVADVRVGSCLSGGVDSSAIVALAAQSASNQALDCFCASFDDVDAQGRTLSEWPYARAVAQESGANLHLVQPDVTEIVAIIDRVLLHQGEPFSHSSILAQFEVFRAAREKGVAVMLDGQGADELFGGYSGMLGHRLGDILVKDGYSQWRAAVRSFARDDADLDESTLKRATFNALVPERVRRGLARARGRWPQMLQMTRDETSLLPKLDPKLDRFEGLMRQLQGLSSLPGLLRYEDRNAMAHAVETRLPFLGRDVVDVAWRIPSKLKARDGWTKAVLRDAVRGVVPEQVLARRRKLGFITPQDKWMLGELGDWVHAGRKQAQARFSDILSETGVANVMAGLGKDGAANAAAFRLACLGHWGAQFNVAL